MSKSLTMKDVATYFYDSLGVKYDSHTFKITIAQIKTLQRRGHSLEDIHEVIGYVSRNAPKNGVHSFGYIVIVIDDIKKILFDLENQPTATLPNSNIKTTGNKNKIRQMKVNYDTDLFE